MVNLSRFTFKRNQPRRVLAITDQGADTPGQLPNSPADSCCELGIDLEVRQRKPTQVYLRPADLGRQNGVGQRRSRLRNKADLPTRWRGLHCKVAPNGPGECRRTAGHGAFHRLGSLLQMRISGWRAAGRRVDRGGVVVGRIFVVDDRVVTAPGRRPINQWISTRSKMSAGSGADGYESDADAAGRTRGSPSTVSSTPAPIINWSPRRVRDVLRANTSFKNWYVVHSAEQSTLYYGFYRTVDKSDPTDGARGGAGACRN